MDRWTVHTPTAQPRAYWRRFARDADASGRLTAAGFEVRYRRTHAVRAELEDLAAAERVCCPFATSSVGAEPTVLVPTVTLAAADTASTADSAAELFGVDWRA